MTQFDQRYQQVDTQYNAEYITIQQQPLSLTEKQRKRNRSRMLDRVQAIWIEGVFDPSVQGAAQIALELEHKPSAVVTPLWHVLREFDTTGRVSSADASIVQVYDHANGEVLILGEPGSGKTILLLELTRTLLERARQDEAHPIPVVFPLSFWATRRQPLTEWLASELHTKYQIPLPLATSWIETDQVLPLLDGLDEVAEPHRAACVEAINTYRQAHGLLPTVVCSRQTDYLALSTRLLLRTAVVVQPLTPEQIESYLTSGGERLAVLRQTLREDAELRALASTPLMLNVLTAAYQGTTPQERVATGSFGMKQEQVFASYVQRMLTRRNTSTRYTPGQTIHWLSSLAGQMKSQSQTVFYIEQMQPDWLSGTRMLRAYHWLAVRLPGVLIGILVSLAISTLLIPSFAHADLVTSIFLGGLLGELLSEGSTTQRPAANSGKVRSIPWQQFLQRLLVGILIGLGVGLSYVLSVGLSVGLSYGLIIGLGFGLCSILLQVLLVKINKAQSPSQTFLPVWRTKWQRVIRSTALRNGLLAGLLVGLISGLSYWLSVGLISGLIGGLISGLRYGLSFGLSTGFLSLLLIGKSITVQLTDRLIWSWTSLGRSLRSSQHVRVTLQIAALGGLSFGLISGLSYWLNVGLIFGLIFGLSVGLGYWLLIGLFQGVSSETIGDQQRMAPNQGIRRSTFNGLVLGFISAMSVGLGTGLGTGLSHGLSYGLSYGLSHGLSTGLSHGLSTGLSYGLSTGLSNGLIIGLSTGLLAGLLKGGLAYLRHYVLHFLLWRSGAIPWNYPRFLDDAAECILLRKVGGGYIFLHRLLLDYFANLETGLGSNVSAEGRQEPRSPDAMPSPFIEPTRADEHAAVPTTLLASTPGLSEVPPLLPCGHEQRLPNARFCTVCGAPISSSALE